MSSFSSVIRKPGGKVAPKVAPRRNIVRKSAQAVQSPAQSQTQTQTQSPVPSALPAPATPWDDSSSIAQRPSLVDPTVSYPVPPELRSDSINDFTSHGAIENGVGDGHITHPSQVGTEPTVRALAHAPWSHSPTQQDGDAGLFQPDVAYSHTKTAEASYWPKQKPRPARTTPSQSSRPSDFRSSGRVELPATNLPAVDGDASSISSNGISLPAAQSSRPEQGAISPSDHPTRSARKQPPRGSVDLMLAHASVATLPTPPPTQPPLSPHRTRAPSTGSKRVASVASRQPEPISDAEEALDRVNANLRKINQLAASIEATTRASRSRSRANHSVDLTDNESTSAGGRPRKRRKTSNHPQDTTQAQAGQLVANTVGATDLAPGRGRRRHRTPDDPEAHQIEPETTMMGDLLSLKHKWGKKSDKEKEIEAHWPEILRRRKADAEARLAAALEGRRKKLAGADSVENNPQSDGHQPMEAAVVPDLAIENGKIVAINRERDLQAQTQKVADADEGKVLEDQDIYKRVNQTTIGSRQTIAPGQRWDDVNTEMFYQGLKMFGTDFKMISNMIPGKNRKQVKLKYNIEERLNFNRIKRCLDQKEDVNLDQYAELTGLTMVNFADVYKEMEEDEKKLREEDEARRREEGIISQQQRAEHADGEADVAIPSIEWPDGEPVTAPDGATVSAAADRQSTAGVSRLGSTTTGRQTAQPTGRKKQTKKASSTATSKRGRAAAKKNKGFEGVEERLGDVGDVGIPMS